MYRKATVFPISIIIIIFVGLAVWRSTSTTGPTQQVSGGNYTAPQATSIPKRYQNIKGVALYSVAAEINEQLASLGAQAPSGSDRFFVLLNPKVPTEGILVQSNTALPSADSGLSNHTLTVSGNVATIPQPQSAMAKYFQEKYGFSLACDGQGQVIYIIAEELLDPDSTPTPAASSPDGSIPPTPTTIELLPQNEVLSGTAEPDALAPTSTPNGETSSPSPDIAEPSTVSDDTTSKATGSTPSPSDSQETSQINERDALPEHRATPKGLSITPRAKVSAGRNASPETREQVSKPSVATSSSNPTTASTIPTSTAAPAPENIVPTPQHIEADPEPSDIAPTPTTL